MILCIFRRIVHEKIQKVENNRVQYGVTPLLFRYIEYRAKIIMFAALYSKSTSIVQQKKKCKKPNMSNHCVFR